MKVCVCSNLGHLLLCIIADSPRAAGSFSRDFTTNLAPQYRAFSRALEIKKLKAPLFSSRKGTGDTNDWCISHGSYCMAGMQTQIRLLREEHAARGLRCLSLSDCHTLPDSTNGRVTDSKILCPFVSVHMRFLSVPRAVNAFRVR